MQREHHHIEEDQMNEYERNARHNSVDPPRVYKLVREKQRKVPVQHDEGKDYVYRGN